MTRSIFYVALLAGLFTVPAAAQPQAEWTLTTGRVTVSAARFADVDGNGVQDVVLATMGPIGDPFSSGSVQVRDAAGVDLPGFPVITSEPLTGGAAAVGDIDDDGDVEIVVSGWFEVVVLNHDGTALPGWPKPTGTASATSPALADLDGDGDLEIIVPTGVQMQAWHHDGSNVSGWPQSASESFQAAAVGDIDGDDELEVVAGTWRPQFPDTVPFELHAWNADGTSVFVVGDLGSIRGAISLGDVDNDGGIEIVTRAGDTLHVFDAAGNEEPGWPVVTPDLIRNATPSVGDLDNDGDLEIVIGGFDINAFHHDGTPVDGWPVDPGATGNINSGVVIASIDEDPTIPEVIVKIANNIVAYHGDGTTVTGYPLSFSDDNQSATFSPTPAVGDVDGNGTVELAYVSVSGTLAYYDEADPIDLAFWPQFQHDVENTSFLDGGPGVPGDVNGDGVVDVLDLVLVITGWGPCPPPPCAADLDGDGEIGVGDLIQVIVNWS
jgi:hypothetical protein